MRRVSRGEPPEAANGVPALPLLSDGAKTGYAHEVWVTIINKSSMKNKVCIIGSGNWGSAIALAVGVNTAAHPDLFERQVRWRRCLQMRAHAFLVLLLSSFATFGRFLCIALKNWLRAANSPRSSIPLTRMSSKLLQRVLEFFSLQSAGISPVACCLKMWLQCPIYARPLVVRSSSSAPPWARH